jgi:hypothetical protein
MTKLALLVLLVSACEHDPKYERDGRRTSPAAEPRSVDQTIEHPNERLRPLERSAPVDIVPTHTPLPAPKPKAPVKHRHHRERTSASSPGPR